LSNLVNDKTTEISHYISVKSSTELSPPTAQSLN